MASIKNLKKDVNFLTSEVIETCLMKLSFDKATDSKELYNLIENFIDYRNETIQKLNNPDKRDKKITVKKYYDDIYDQFLQKVDQTFEKLNGSVKEKA